MSLIRPIVLAGGGTPKELPTGSALYTGLRNGFQVVFNGYTAPPAVSLACELRVPRALTIKGWTIFADVSGSIVIDVLRATYAAYPTLSSIASTEKPTLSSAVKNQNLSLSAFTTALAAGDILQFVVNSASTLTRATVEFDCDDA